MRQRKYRALISSKKCLPVRISITSVTDLSFLDPINHQTCRNILNHCLTPGIIDAYLSLIRHDSVRSTFIFPCHFYSILNEVGPAEASNYVATEKDLFGHSLLLIPVHRYNHWSLIIIDLENQKFQHFDSFPPNRQLQEQILSFFRRETSQRGIIDTCLSEFDRTVPALPRQMNGVDSGVFCCEFARLTLLNRDYGFSAKDVSGIRLKIRAEIQKSTR